MYHSGFPQTEICEIQGYSRPFDGIFGGFSRPKIVKFKAFQGPSLTHVINCAALSNSYPAPDYKLQRNENEYHSPPTSFTYKSIFNHRITKLLWYYPTSEAMGGRRYFIWMIPKWCCHVTTSSLDIIRVKHNNLYHFLVGHFPRCVPVYVIESSRQNIWRQITLERLRIRFIRFTEMTFSISETQKSTEESPIFSRFLYFFRYWDAEIGGRIADISRIQGFSRPSIEIVEIQVLSRPWMAFCQIPGFSRISRPSGNPVFCTCPYDSYIVNSCKISLVRTGSGTHWAI